MSQIKKLINQKFLEGIDSTKFHVAQNGAIMAKDSSGSMVEFLKVNSDNKGVVLGKVISTKDEVDQLISDLAAEVSARQAGDLDAKAYADQKIADLVNGAPALLDTLKELADAIANDENFAATIGAQIGQLQSGLAAEIARAEAAEAALAGRLDAVEPKVTTLEGEMDEAQADIIALEGRMSTAESDINAVEAGLAQEIADRQSAVSSVQSELDAVDGRLVNLEDDHDLLSGEVADLSDELSLEVSRAEAAESALDSRLDAVEPKVSTLETEMDQAQADIDAVESGLAQEITNRETADLNFLKLDGSRPMQGAFQLGSNELNGAGNGRYVYLNWNGLSFSNGAQDQWLEITKNIDGEKDVINSHAGVELRGEFTVVNSMNAPSPTSDSHVANKEYVDEQDAAKLQEAKDYTDSEVSAEETRAMAAEALKVNKSGDSMSGKLTIKNTSENPFDVSGTGAQPGFVVEGISSFKDSAGLEVVKIQTGASRRSYSAIKVGDGTNYSNVGSQSIDSPMFDITGSLTPQFDSNATSKKYVNDQDAAKLVEAKSYADAAVLVEKNRAEAAESGLQSAIDVEKGRVDAILDASQADKDSFAEIVSLINSVDTENDSAFASYVLSNNAALAQEASDRQTGDSALEASIIAETTRAMTAEGALSQAIADEMSRAQAAEGVLQSNIDAEAVARATADTTLQGNINSEQSAREQADIALGGRIDSVESSVSSLSSTKADKSYVDAQDAALQSDIDDVDGRVADLQDEHDLLSGEVVDIRDDLEGEISRAGAAEAALGGRLDTAESKISALEALSFHKEFKTIGASDLMHVDLLLKAKPKSVKVYVGRLALHEDHDFTVGENMGVTRIYWTGDFAVGGAEEIEEGMKLFFEYYC